MTSNDTPFDAAPWDVDSDKLREECGIFGVIGSRDAAAMTALGLHALQHRGQEAVGITSFDGQEFYSRRGTGHVAQNFSSAEALDELPGVMAAGHVRYSTTGGSGLRNVQPLFADLATGGFAIAHNGNISNAMHLKHDLVQKGAIFQSTSDTEVIIHLVATSRYPTLLDRFVDALRLVEGAYSLICMTPQGMIACRDPLGIRPLVMGRLGEATVFASETVGLDAIGAEFVREVEPGEMVEVSLANTTASPSRPITSGRMPRGSRQAIMPCGVMQISEYAPSTMRRASTSRSSRVVKRLVATRWMITSVSEVDWKIAPLRTSSSRKVRALEILPLCATAKPPAARSA